MNRDKNNIEDMTQKYKEEMMRLYSKNRRAAPPAPPMTETPKPAASAVPRTPSAPPVPPETQMRQTVPPMTETPKPVTESAVPRTPSMPSVPPEMQMGQAAPQMPDLSHPPMPKIPRDYDTGNRMPQRDTSPTARFRPVETEEHTQGNYDFPLPPAAIAEEEAEQERIATEYPTENTDFETLYDESDSTNPPPSQLTGKGYLKVEVTTGDGAIPVENAAVVVTERINGMDSLISMMVTNRNGETDVIPLPAPPQSLSESANPSEKPCSEYNISVYKRGFFSVPQLTVPIFDTVKSIQPVALIPLAEFEMQGTERPMTEQ